MKYNLFYAMHYFGVCLSKLWEHLEELLKGHQGIGIQALRTDHYVIFLATTSKIRKLMSLKALKDLVAAMFECELLKHAEGGILACPGGEGGPTIDSQVDEDSCQFVLFRHFLQ